MKSIYEFTKILSVLFLLSGIGFIFSNMYLLAVIGILGFFIIKLVDSDFVFNTFQLENPGKLVVSVTLLIFAVYGFFIYKEMMFSSLLAHMEPAQKTEFITNANKMYSTFSNCVSEHNTAVSKMRNGTVAEKDVKIANRACYNVSKELEKAVVTGKYSKSAAGVLKSNQAEMIKVSKNLMAYSYSTSKPQEFLVKKVQDGLAVIEGNKKRMDQLLGTDVEKLENDDVSLSF